MNLTFQTTGEPLTDLAILLRAARVQAAALRNEPDSHTHAFVRCLHDELTDQIDGLQDAQCDDADADAARRSMIGHNRRGGWVPDAQDMHNGMDRAEVGA